MYSPYLLPKGQDANKTLSFTFLESIISIG